MIGSSQREGRHRIWVFRRGRIAGVVDRDKTTGNEVVSMITGVSEKAGEAEAYA